MFSMNYVNIYNNNYQFFFLLLFYKKDYLDAAEKQFLNKFDN